MNNPLELILLGVALEPASFRKIPRSLSAEVLATFPITLSSKGVNDMLKYWVPRIQVGELVQGSDTPRDVDDIEDRHGA